MNRNLLLVLVVSACIVLAGCTGGLGGDGAAQGTAGGSGDNGGSGGSGDDAGAGAGDSSALQSGEWEPFDFDEPAKYTYDVYTEGDGEGTLVLDVQEVSGDTITVKTVYEMAGERYESTFTGTKENVQGQMMMNPAGIILMTTMIQPGAWYAGQDLEVGTQWSYSTQEGSASFEVTGTETVAGVECYHSEMTVNSSVMYEGCFAPQLGLAPYTAYYEEDGTLSMELELVSYEKN
ncbi:hypothetical protein [Haloarchaeobius sp. DFWS5]|uniref:hypothetical protein n=1 Tax=Haloarchaeobius sp. DFWS5 TaxID=3446114 RepID=UPI003EBA8DDC